MKGVPHVPALRPASSRALRAAASSAAGESGAEGAQVAENPTAFAPVLVRDDARNCSVCRFRTRVRYAETDRMGIAYNAHYLAWFEMGRTELMRCSGMSYRTIEERGVLLPLVAADLKLRMPIAYDDVITIESWIGKMRSRTVTFAYRIYRDAQLAAEGSTTHACVASGKNETVVLPDWLLAHLMPLAS